MQLARCHSLVPFGSQHVSRDCPRVAGHSGTNEPHFPSLATRFLDGVQGISKVWTEGYPRGSLALWQLHIGWQLLLGLSPGRRGQWTCAWCRPSESAGDSLEFSNNSHAEMDTRNSNCSLTNVSCQTIIETHNHQMQSKRKYTKNAQMKTRFSKSHDVIHSCQILSNNAYAQNVIP